MIRKTAEAIHQTYHKVKESSGPLKGAFIGTERAASAAGSGFQKIYAARFGKAVLAIALVAAAYYGYAYYAAGEKKLNTVVVHAGGAESTVAVQGSIEPAQNVVLGFEGSGRVSSVNVEVGQKVSAGSALASLSQGDTAATIESQRALRDAAQARLDELKRGPRPEDIAVVESQLATAQSQLAQAQTTLTDSLNDAYSKLDDAVRSKTDMLLTNPRSTTPQFMYPADGAVKVSLESQRAQVETALQTLGSRVLVSPSDEDVAATKATVQQVRAYLDIVAQAVSRLPAFTSLSQTTIDGYTAAVATARANVSGYSTSLSAAATAYNNARTAVKTAENQLALKKAGSSEEEIRAQAAQVRAAEASLNNAYAQSAKRVIVAPFSGTVTSVDLKEGQVVSGGTSTITLISAAKLQVEAYVPEVYIAKVKLNDPANVTLDAYGSNVVFPATVSSIDPAATKRDGIATYKIVLALDAPDARIKAGMGGDIVIKTKAASTIITIPKRALVTRNGKSYVQIPTGVEGRVVEREVNVGKINEANVAEISAGLSDGDTIVLDPIQ